MFLEVIDVQLFGALNMGIEGYLYQEKCSLYELPEQHLCDVPSSSARALCCAVPCCPTAGTAAFPAQRSLSPALKHI